MAPGAGAAATAAATAANAAIRKDGKRRGGHGRPGGGRCLGRVLEDREGRAARRRKRQLLLLLGGWHLERLGLGLGLLRSGGGGSLRGGLLVGILVEGRQQHLERRLGVDLATVRVRVRVGVRVRVSGGRWPGGPSTPAHTSQVASLLTLRPLLFLLAALAAVIDSMQEARAVLAY